ncbi:MAG TPA: sulfatase/phosphatase domain-containing protein [Bryobacteraceae bacterium]
MYAGSRFDSLNLDRAAAPNAREGRDMLADPVAGMRKAAAAITALDDEIGALVTKLAERKLRDGTIVIFTATCGALLGRHGLWDAGAASEPVNLYDETVATPMFWSWLGRVPAQATRPELVTALDVVPTLCEITGAPLPAGNLYGRSYLPLLTGQPLPKKQPWRTTVCARYQGADMAREERYKLVLRDGGKGPNELFDISQDPRERVNQYDNGSYTTVKDRLAAEVARWKQRYSS